MKAYFLGWQCRIRQMSVREFEGQPMEAMRPRVSTKNGEIIVPGMMVLLVPEDPSPSTAFFKFQMQKTNEIEEARRAALGYMGAEYFQLPGLFSDEMTAVFGAGSPTAAIVLKHRSVLLEFEQSSQSFRVPCKPRRLGSKELAREASLWQARLFNRNLSQNAVVLGFKPDWKGAIAAPMPTGSPT